MGAITCVMTPEVATYQNSILSRLERVVAALDGLTEAQLNWRPPVAGGNSAYVLAVHTLGNARAWVLGIACGEPLRRDRPAEFASRGASVEALRDELRDLSAHIEKGVAALTPADLERRLVPPRELWGEGEPHEISVREAFLHVTEHASLHLGHVELTRDLALASEA